MTLLIDWFLDEDPGKDQLDNMSCRPRTTVNSDPIPSLLRPDRISGKEVSFALEREACHWHYMLKKTPGFTDQKIFHALYVLGTDKNKGDYEDFINRTKRPGEKLLELLKDPPEMLKWVPDIGVVVPEHKNADSHLIENVRQAMYFLSHTNDNLFIRNKSPIMSGIAPGRKIIIRYYPPDNGVKRIKYRTVKRRVK